MMARAVLEAGLLVSSCAILLGCPDAVRGTALEGRDAGDETNANANANDAGRATVDGEAPTGTPTFDRTWSTWGVDGPEFPSNYTTVDGVVTDVETALSWPAAPIKTPVAWSAASGACQALRVGGFTDWRVPTRIELSSLATYSKTQGPKTNSSFETPFDEYWTSSVFKDNPSHAWAVEFQLGGVVSMPKAEAHLLRCVRGGRTTPNAAAYRFVAAPGTVFDNQTTLLWQADSVPARNFLDARTYCRDLVIESVSGFRLPLLHELHSIVDESRVAPALAPPFTSSGGAQTWSTTPMAGSSTFEWGLDFTTGETMEIEQAAMLAVRCVK